MTLCVTVSFPITFETHLTCNMNISTLVQLQVFQFQQYEVYVAYLPQFIIGV